MKWSTTSMHLFFNEEDGILTIRPPRDFKISETFIQAKENVEQYTLLGEKLKGILAFMPDHYVNVEVTRFYKENAPLVPVAMIADSSFKKMMGNFLLSLGTKTRPVRLFTAEEEAKKWLDGKVRRTVPSKDTYLFRSERLGFRNWEDRDIPKMTAISADADVMEFFPAPATPEQTRVFISSMKKMFREKGYCYFAVDLLKSGEFIGFIGLSDKTFEAEFTPCVDIGWRLGKEHWNKGYATEGARRCLTFALQELGLETIKSTAPLINRKSVRIMEKIGMQKELEFKHPYLSEHKRLEDCVCYTTMR